MKKTSIEEPYVLTSWVNALLAGFRMEGCDDQEIISLSGVSPDLLERGYCSLDTLTAVFDAAQSLYGDPVSLESNKGTTPSSFRSLSLAILSSETLADGFGLLLKHNSIITNVLGFIVDLEGGGRFGFVVQEDIELSLPLSCAILGRAMRTAVFIHPSSKLLTKVEMAYVKPENSEEYERYFDAPVEWSCQYNVLYFEESAFNCITTHANSTLCITAEKNWLDEVAAFNELSFMLSANAFVKAHLSGTRLTVESAAQEFGMSVRTFQRRLDLEGTSFSKLIDFVRKEESVSLINNAKLSLSDIAYTLGFSDAGSFSRAFRRWFEQSPEQYRKQLT